MQYVPVGLDIVFAEKEDTARLRRPTPESLASPGPRNQGVLTVLRGTNAGALFTLDGRHWVIGRASEAQILLTDDALSRRHACIKRSAGSFYIEDLASTNGTFVDGNRIHGPCKLADGNRIKLGASTVLRFALHDEIEQEAARRTHEMTVRDPLTNTFNRRHLEERLLCETAYSARHQTPLSLIVIDVDHFKSVNDNHGHEVGDKVLRAVARMLGDTLRAEDVLARLGGDEFVALARGINDRAGGVCGERIRRGAEQLRIETSSGPIRITVSVGVAGTQGGRDIDPADLMTAADEALYAAKEQGRNCVSVAMSSRIPSRCRPSGTRHRRV